MVTDLEKKEYSYENTQTNSDIVDHHSDREGSVEEEVFGEDRNRLSQSLDARHIDIIAFVGVIGTGVFLSTGSQLHIAGPLGIFIAYLLIGIVVGCNQIAVAEVASLMPTSSATVRHLEQFFDEALGFAYGWIFVYTSIMPGELSAAAVIISYWTDLNPAIWISIMMVIMIATNIYSVRVYAESEVFFGYIKLCLIIGLIIFSIVITCGGGPDHKTIGFRYWKHPYGPVREYLTTGATGRLAAVWKVMISAVYSYSGVQAAPSLAGELKYPRRAVFRACKRTFIRVTSVMCLAVFCLTLIVPATDKRISTGSGTASSSPFVVAAKNAGVKVLPHIINAAVLTSAFSAGNLGIVHGSRTLFALAVKKQAPKIFLKTNKRGVPYVGLMFVVAFMPLSFMSISKTSGTVFSWFQALATGNTMIGWVFISLNHICLHRAMRAQGYTRADLPYTIPGAEYAAWFSGIASAILLLTGGFKNFVHGNFLIDNFFSSYFIFPFTAVFYFGWKFWKKTKILKPEEVDLKSLFEDLKNNPEPPYPRYTGIKWLLNYF